MKEGPLISILMPVGGLIDGCPWRSHARDWVTARYAAMFPDAELALGTSQAEPYNRSEARNNAFEASHGAFLIIVDADTIIPQGGIVRALSAIQTGAAPWAMPYETYLNLNDKATYYVLNEYPPETVEIEEPPPEVIEHRIENSPAGAWVMPRAAYEAVGGFDERFIGWGAEDDSFVAALDTLVGPHKRCAGTALHLWHPRGDADFGHEHWDLNAVLLRRYHKARTVPRVMERLVKEHQRA